jgi:hypothetical protein
MARFFVTGRENSNRGNSHLATRLKDAASDF